MILNSCIAGNEYPYDTPLNGHVTHWKMAETHKTLEVLPQHGTLMDEQDSDGVSRLMRASANGDTQTVKSLLDEGAQVNWQGNHGDTALLYACAEISSNKRRKVLIRDSKNT